jgi:hypothetical protein
MVGFRFWSLSALYTAGSALLLGIPTRLIPTPLFSRMVPTSPQDYVIWIVSALLLGPLLSLMTLYPHKRGLKPASGQRVGPPA